MISFTVTSEVKIFDFFIKVTLKVIEKFSGIFRVTKTKIQKILQGNNMLSGNLDVSKIKSSHDKFDMLKIFRQRHLKEEPISY